MHGTFLLVLDFEDHIQLLTCSFHFAGVAYLLGTGAELDFGESLHVQSDVFHSEVRSSGPFSRSRMFFGAGMQGQPCKIDFEQKTGDSPMMEMLMKVSSCHC